MSRATEVQGAGMGSLASLVPVTKVGATAVRVQRGRRDQDDR